MLAGGAGRGWQGHTVLTGLPRPSGVLGRGVPLPRLLNIDFTNADIDVIEVSAAPAPRGAVRNVSE